MALLQPLVQAGQTGDQLGDVEQLLVLLQPVLVEHLARIGMLSRSTAHTKGKREAVSWRAAACPSTGPTGFKPPRVQSALELDAAEGRRREGDFAPGINNVSHYSSLSFIESTKGQEERGERCVNSEEQVNMSTEGNRKSTNWTFTLLNRKEESKKIRICRL